jgi:hypothetical protein
MTRLQLLTALLIGSLGAPAAAQTDTAFVYQGALQNGSGPASGQHDIAVSLWDAPIAGGQISSTRLFEDVPVADGLFAIEIDFGAAAFDNEPRWLEIAVNGTTLSPRQRLARAPYAIQTRGIVVDEAGALGLGTPAPAERLTVTGRDNTGPRSAAMTLENTAAAGRSYLVGSTAQGEFQIADMTAGGITRLLMTANGNVGIGTGTPASPLHVVSGARIAAQVDSSASDAVSFIGQATASSGSGTGVVGRSMSAGGTGVQGSSEGSGVVGESTGGRGVFGFTTFTTGVGIGVHGNSSSPAGWDFYASGAGIDYGSSSSIRWKHNVEAIDDPLYKLSKIRGVYFDWDEGHGGHHDIGLIAEEVGAVLPEIVQYESNGLDAIGLDYARLTPLLVEAVKALRAEHGGQIAALRAERDARVAALERENTDLRARLDALEQLVERLASTSHEENQR